jgi:HPt (histidine-containing phosphotransfer) domain-containing protein
MPVIDLMIYEKLKSDVGADFIGELVETYLADTSHLISQLTQAFENQDVEAFRRVAHSIKSTSYSLGAIPMGEQAKELEMMARENNLPGALAQITDLTQVFEQVRQALRLLQIG